MKSIRPAEARIVAKPELCLRSVEIYEDITKFSAAVEKAVDERIVPPGIRHRA